MQYRMLEAIMCVPHQCVWLEGISVACNTGEFRVLEAIMCFLPVGDVCLAKGHFCGMQHMRFQYPIVVMCPKFRFCQAGGITFITCDIIQESHVDSVLNHNVQTL